MPLDVPCLVNMTDHIETELTEKRRLLIDSANNRLVLYKSNTPDAKELSRQLDAIDAKLLHQIEEMQNRKVELEKKRRLLIDSANHRIVLYKSGIPQTKEIVRQMNAIDAQLLQQLNVRYGQ